MTKSKEVAVKNDYEVSKEFSGMFDSSLVSAGDTMDKDDFRIPKLTLIQAMTKSSFNTEGVEAGNFINSIDKNDMGSSMDMFIMTDVKLWQWDYEVKKGKEIKKEYLTITEFADFPDARKVWDNNPALPPEVVAKMERNEVKRDHLLAPDMIYRFYVLLVDELKDGFAFPYIVDFKRSSAPDGNKLKNIFFKMRKVANLPSYAKVFNLHTEFIQSEYDYYVKKVSTGRNIEKEELAAVENWIKELTENAKKYKADESDNTVEDVVDAEVINNGDKPQF